MKIKNNLAHMCAAVWGIGLGIVTASTLSNKINNLNTSEENRCNRKIKLKDSLMQLDDIASALVMAKVPLVDKLHINKILPFLYLNCGYETGTQK